MKEDREIREALERLDAGAAPHDLPSAAEAWSRLQFRLAYRARRDNSAGAASTLLAPALYVLGFLIWATWSAELSPGLLSIVAAAAAASLFLLLRVTRSFRN